MINLLSKDLRKEEVYVQIADQLEYLEKLTSKSFDQINNKLKFFNNDLIKIERRREIVKLKIEQIKKNNNKAIQIFSPFYYPAKNLREKYKYESIIENNRSKNQIKDKKQPEYSIKQPFELFHPDELNEMLNFCDLDTFLKTERESFSFLQRQKLNKSSIPWNRINSISSLIIFNSSETAYIKTDQDSSIYEFKTANKQKKSEEDNELNFGNFAPPKSMIKKENFEQNNLFKYDPQELPEVLDNLPNDLDLDAVADDIFFKEEVTFNFTNSNDLMDSEKETENNNNHQMPSKLFKIFSSDQLSNSSSLEENNQKSTNEKNLNEKQIDSVNLSTTIIPKPPPLPDSPSNFESSTGEQDKKEDKKPVVVAIGDNSRANLLDAIRKAGGRPDKTGAKTTIKEKKLEEKKNRKEAVSTDLMSDLKKHLMSRRKAMVGAKLDNKKDKPQQIKREDSVYDTMNKMIPSPNQSSDSDNISDDDWVNN